MGSIDKLIQLPSYTLSSLLIDRKEHLAKLADSERLRT
jgi:hypothetical protein